MVWGSSQSDSGAHQRPEGFSIEATPQPIDHPFPPTHGTDRLVWLPAPRQLQSFGAVVVLSEADLSVRHLSTPLMALTGLTADQLLGVPLPDHLAPGSARRLQQVARLNGGPHPVRIRLNRPGSLLLEGSLHRFSGRILLDLEPAAPAAISVVTGLHNLAATRARLESAQDVDTLMNALAEGIQVLTGFDRVAVHHVDEAGTGRLAAEVGTGRLPGLGDDPLTGQQLPPAARTFLRRQRLRLIADVEAQPATIQSLSGAEEELFDLTPSIMRWPTPGHRAWLRSLGVRATLALAVVGTDRMHAMISAHHQTANTITPPVRHACDLLAREAGDRLAHLERQAARHRRDLLASGLVRLHERLLEAELFGDALMKGCTPLLPLLGATGAATLDKGAIFTTGEVPPFEIISDMLGHLVEQDGKETIGTERAAPRIQGWHLRGWVGIRVGEEATDWLLLFRPPSARGTLTVWPPDLKRLAPLVADRLRRTSALRTGQARGQAALVDSGRALLEGLDPSCAVDPGGRLTAFNERFARLVEEWTGDRPELGGHMPEMSGGLDDWWSRSLTEALKGRFKRRTRTITLKGRPRVVELLTRPATSPDGMRWGVATLRDITGSRVAELRRQDEYARALQSRQFERLGALAGGIAHDFNNLLAVIRGNAELIGQREPLSEDAREGLGELMTATRSAAALTERMLSYSGHAPMKQVVMDLRSVAANAAERCESVPTLSPADQRLPVKVDPGQVEMAVVHLLDNAREAMEETSGTITVETRFEQLDRPYMGSARLAEPLPPGAYAVVEVIDQGVGMDEDVRQRAEEPFFTTRFTGRGLGLPAAKGVVTAHGGALELISAPDQGTRARIWLPLAEQEAEIPLPVTPTPVEGQRVLIIDDDPGIRRVIRRGLITRGYEVHLAEDGPSGLALYERLRAEGPISAVVLDLTMPEMDGVEVMKRLHDLQPDQPVLLVSGYAHSEVAERLDADARHVHFLKKPFRLDEVRSAVAELCVESATFRS